MAVNLYDHANQLEQALRESDEYKAIQNAYTKVKENQESKDLFDEFRETQLSFQQNKCKVKKSVKKSYKSTRTSSKIENDSNISELMVTSKT